MEENKVASSVSSAAKVEAQITIPDHLEVMVVDMDKVLYRGKADSMIFPAIPNNFAVLPGHTPLFAKLDKGNLIIDKGEGNLKEIEIGGGVAKVTQFKVVVLVDYEEKRKSWAK